MESIILSNDKLTVKVSYSEPLREFFQRLMAFISPVFITIESVGAVDDTIDLHLMLHPSINFPADWKTICVSERTIRRSTAEAFNIVLRCGKLHDNHQIAWHERDRTGYVWRQAGRQMEMYVSHDSFIHVIEFFRYYLLSLEVAKGSLVLHATGVVNHATGGIVAICGSKGAGKTSTMLNLTISGAFHYFSGDKLLIDTRDGELRVRGWPDYPHVGAGSLRQHPTFCHKIGLTHDQPPLSTAENSDKFLFVPELFYGALGKSAQRKGTLEAVVLPDVKASTLFIAQIGGQEKSALDANRLFEDPHDFITATWHGLDLPASDKNITAIYQEVRDHLYKLNWLKVSGNVSATDLATRLDQGKQLRLALVASSGSGKSTTAKLLKEAFNQRNFSVGTEKLAQPLYSLQKAYFAELEQSVQVDAQHQLLMEKIADNLRMLDPRALVDHLFRRLEDNHAQIILTDDLRDKKTDWPALVEQGFIVIRVLCNEENRQQRLNVRHDLQSQLVSSLDDDINAIRSDFTIDNNGDLDQLRAAVSDLVERLLRRRYE